MITNKYGIKIYIGDDSGIFDNCIVNRTFKSPCSKIIKSFNSRWLVNNLYGIRLIKIYIK